jgi:hypothetical protein
MLMKTKQVLALIAAILFAVGWQAPVRAQEIPINYHQNPNIEHEFSTLFWSGWDDTWYGIYTHPGDYKTDEFAHSGNYSLEIWVMQGGATSYGTWVWVSYPVRGHEEKKMKTSFWYRGHLVSYWNFLYRDCGLTWDDLHPKLAEFTGADSAYWGGEDQDAIQFHFGGDDEYEEDWTYFEFVWDFPGTIPGWGNTAMWWTDRDSAYVDDIYYGLWFDGVYNGEEPFGFVNGDLEDEALGAEWSVNEWPGDFIDAIDFLSLDQNHTDPGYQSLRLMDYWLVTPAVYDTNDVVAPYDSIEITPIDTSFQDRNVTYYLPAMNAEGEDMELSFWYKGNEACVDLFFYKNYGITTDDMPVPAGAQLRALETIYEITDSTLIYDSTQVISADTAHLLSILPPVSVGSENFDDVSGAPAFMDWNWSGANHFGYNDWAGQITEDQAYSSSKSLWLPGDPGWSGAEGTLPGIVDGGAYALSFMYIGDLQLVMKFGESLKYDLMGDPDGIVPAGVDTSAKEITWNLSSDDWKDFSFAWEVGTWLSDSGVTSPAGLVFDLVGTYTTGDNGYVDDFEFFEVTVPVDILAKQNFDGLDGAQPVPMDWNWSGSNFFGYNDWDGEMVETESYSPPTSFWLPGDPNWTGSEGSMEVTDSVVYDISFMYKGKLQFTLDLGSDLKYDLEGDPDGIIPEEATVDDGQLVWNLSGEGWKKFSYAWEQGSWLEDSAVTSPANLNFAFVGTYTSGDDGYVDNLLIEKSKVKIGAVSLIESGIEIYAVYAIDSVVYDTTYSKQEVIVGGDSDLEPQAIHWSLPAAANWTEWKLNWTNPSTDIGATLTLILDNETAVPDWITPAKKTFDDEHAGWTYFDDFVYEITTGIDNRVQQKQLHLYPNPVVDILYLSIEEPLQRINVYNSLGQLVKSVNNSDNKINVSNLSSGMYMLNVTDQRGIVYKSKFIKE